MPGRPTKLDNGRARFYCACSRFRRDCPDIFSLAYHFSFLSLSLSGMGGWMTYFLRLFQQNFSYIRTIDG